MRLLAALALVIALGLLCSVAGCGIGYGVGTFVPDYYREHFWAG